MSQYKGSRDSAAEVNRIIIFKKPDIPRIPIESAKIMENQWDVQQDKRCPLQPYVGIERVNDQQEGKRKKVINCPIRFPKGIIDYKKEICSY